MECSKLNIGYGMCFLSLSLISLVPDFLDPRACYLAMPLYICGFVLLGASFQNHLSIGGLVMGWGISELAVMINTVAVCAYYSPVLYPLYLFYCLRFGSKQDIYLQMRIVMIASRNIK